MMPDNPLPVLYSFRRCPYAMRARMALAIAGIDVQLIEVTLKHKPPALLAASSKGTVPVLCVGERIFDESLDIMCWALSIHDPDGWISGLESAGPGLAMQLIRDNDTAFKPWLDKYKYAVRYPQHPPEFYRHQCEAYLQTLNTLLHIQPYLSGPHITLTDIAIFPFVRQFAMVDSHWFDHSPYQQLKSWLNAMVQLPVFTRIMAKPAREPSFPVS